MGGKDGAEKRIHGHRQSPFLRFSPVIVQSVKGNQNSVGQNYPKLIFSFFPLNGVVLHNNR